MSTKGYWKRLRSFVCLLFLSFGLWTQAQTTALTSTQLFQQMDPQMAEVVQLYDAIKGTPLPSLTPQDARQQFSAQDAAKLLTRGFAAQAPFGVGTVQDGLTIPGRDGNQIPVRIYTPSGAGPFPVILYFHGGGFVIATIDTYDSSGRALCSYSNAIVISVEYRKAPEAPFPAALNDAVDSYEWTIGNIGKYNGLAGKVAVAGESAGGIWRPRWRSRRRLERFSNRPISFSSIQ